MLGPNDLPFAVVGDRCFVKMDPPEERTLGGLHIPQTAQMKRFSGRILDAGLSARDKLYDNGISVPGQVVFGKFAGIIEEWRHIIEGPHDLPDAAYDFMPLPHEENTPPRYKCRNTGAVMVIDPCLVMNVDDVLGSMELATQIRTGSAVYVRGRTADGRTQHVLERAA